MKFLSCLNCCVTRWRCGWRHLADMSSFCLDDLATLSLSLRDVHLVHHLLLLDEHLLEGVEMWFQVLQLHVVGGRGGDGRRHLAAKIWTFYFVKPTTAQEKKVYRLSWKSLQIIAFGPMRSKPLTFFLYIFWLLRDVIFDIRFF